jgi:hypothetical protein
MFRLKLGFFALLMLVLLVVPSVFATPPEEINGWFYWAPEDSPYNYCLFSADDNGAPDGFLEGCVIQPDAPGRAGHGTFYQFPIFPVHDPDNTTGECEYNLATFYVPGRGDVGDPRVVFNRCSGSLEGLHVNATGEAGEFYWTGTYHYGP